MGARHNEEGDRVIWSQGSGRVEMREDKPYLVITYGEKRLESYYSLTDMFRRFEGRVVSVLVQDEELLKEREKEDI